MTDNRVCSPAGCEEFGCDHSGDHAVSRGHVRLPPVQKPAQARLQVPAR